MFNEGNLENMLKVNLPDGSVLEYSRHVRPLDIAADIGPRLAKATLAAVVDGRTVGADSPLPADGQVDLRLLTEEGPRIAGHHAPFVRARDGPGGDAAVRRRRAGVRPDDRQRVLLRFLRWTSRSRRTISRRSRPKWPGSSRRTSPSSGSTMPRDKAVRLCEELKQSLKVEHIDEGLADEATVSFYRQGEFLDLCRGPHLPSPGAIGAFKLLSVAGAYWKGDASARQLQRLYGTAWFSQAGPRRVPQAARRGQTPRPSRAGQATGAVPDRSRGRLRAGPVAAQGGDRPPRAGDVHLRAS